MQQNMSSKITFDINTINEDGLYGPPDGLRALDYEFCIPATAAASAEVRRIDPTYRFIKTLPAVLDVPAMNICVLAAHIKKILKPFCKN